STTEATCVPASEMRPWKSVILSSCTWVPASAAWAVASSVPVEASASSSAPAPDAAPGAESAASLCASAAAASSAVSEGDEAVAEDWPAPRPGAATSGERPAAVSIDTAAPVASTFDTSLDMYSVPSVIHRPHINGAEEGQTRPSCNADANVGLPARKSTQDSHIWEEGFSHNHDICDEVRSYSRSRRAMVCAARAAYSSGAG